MVAISKGSHTAKGSKGRRIFLYTAGTLACLLLLLFLAFRFTPWPSALLIRWAFNKEAIKVNKALEKHVPAGIEELLNIDYDAEDDNVKLDVYYPRATSGSDQLLPVIVWTHGGGWISGNKGQVANYCRILSGKGYVVVSVDYSIAPEKKYPIPVKQLNSALGFISKNASGYRIDKQQIFLAGDSGGAHIASQTANIITSPSYARLLGITPRIHPSQLSGLILFCGPYDTENINLDGDFGSFLKTVLWSYSGSKNFQSNEYFKTASVINYITPSFPPCFISAGNADPLLGQSLAFARKLSSLHVPVDTLFFPMEFQPKLKHEYQFNLDIEAGKQALERTTAFVNHIHTR